MLKNNNQVARILQEGGIIAYPTEGVFGFGCDPFNETAVMRLLKIKNRKINKGLILIAADWKQVKSLVKINLQQNKIFKQHYNEPITWVFPASKKVPSWLSGKFKSIAIRVTLHPVAKRICQEFGGPIVSTSANFEGEKPAKNVKQVLGDFKDKIDFVVAAKVGKLNKPTEIRDIKTNKIIRV
jgi:L-threonylcarbamoyladenylate synthase